MLWIFKDLARQLTADTGLPCILPGEVPSLKEPHFEFDIKSVRLSHAEPGDHEHEEQINALVQDSAYRGPCKWVIGLDLILRSDGTSSDFAARFMKASFDAQRLAGLRIGVIPVGIRSHMLPRSGGILEIVDEAVSWPGALEFNGTIGNTATQGWECVLTVEVSEDVDYVVEDLPAEVP